MGHVPQGSPIVGGNDDDERHSLHNISFLLTIMPPYQQEQSNEVDILLCDCCPFPCDDGFQEWKQQSNIAGQNSIDATDQISISSFDAVSSTISGYSRRSRFTHISASRPRAVYRPRSGLSARVRFILPVESFLSSDHAFEALVPPTPALPPVKEGKALSPRMNKSWNRVSNLFSHKEQTPDENAVESSTPNGILREDARHNVMQEVTLEAYMNVIHDKQEENEEYNGMIIVVAPKGVELYQSATRRQEDMSAYLDDEEDDDNEEDVDRSGPDDDNDGYLDEDDDEISTSIPRDVSVYKMTPGDEVSVMNDDYITFEAARVAQEEVEAAKLRREQHSTGLTVFLKRFRDLREKRRAFRVVSRHGREQYAV